MSEEAKILIKCALQSFPDLTVLAPLDWTVLRLKQHLKSVCPSEPVENRQRLIYSGQCLKDESVLKSVLRPINADGQTHYVIHLVYTPTAEQLRQKREREAVMSSAGTLRHRGSAQQPQLSTPVATTARQDFTPFPTAPGQAGNEGMDLQAQQEMYNAYMANYVNYLNQVYGAFYGGFALPGLAAAQVVPNYGTPFGVPQANLGGVPNVEVPGAEEDLAQAPAQAAPAAAPAEPAMNAQGGVDDEEFHDRDWLDWLYMASRAGLLIMILYFYSSMERFIFVLFCCLFMYGLQAGWFNLGHRAAPAAAQEDEQDQEDPADANREEGVQEEAGPSTSQEEVNEPPADETGASEAPTEEAEEAQDAWTVFRTTSYTFITTFFSSLVPERPPPIDLN